MDRSKYRNPSPPPGYVKPDSRIALKSECLEEGSDLKICNFVALTIESGVLDDSNPSSDFTIQTSDDDVSHLPVAPEVPPLIDLDTKCLELSNDQMPESPDAPPVPETETASKTEVKKPPTEAKDILEGGCHSNDVKKVIPLRPPPAKAKKHDLEKKVVEYNSDSSSEFCIPSKKKKKKPKKRGSKSPPSSPAS